MQFRVPQNIAMEDRIVGPLSPIQFGIVVVGGGFSFFIFQSFWLPSPLNVILALFMAIFTGILAVGKFNDQHMYHFIKFFILFAIRPRIRIWHKEGGEIVLVKPSPVKLEESKQRVAKNVSHKDIARLAMVLDSRGNSGVLPRVGIKPEPTQKS